MSVTPLAGNSEQRAGAISRVLTDGNIGGANSVAMKAVLITLAVFPSLLCAQEAPDASPREWRDARCVAALDADTQEMARAIKDGNDALRPALRERLLSGASFIGDAYLHGTRDEKRARALADQARDEQRNLPPAAYTELKDTCAKEGATLYAGANALQQMVTKRLADKRMRKLLGG